MKQWKFSKINTELTSIKANQSDYKIIDYLIHTFESNPYDPEYKEIVFSKILYSEFDHNKYYLFNILYMEDIIVVYLTNEHGEIKRYFLLSEFDMFE